MTPTTTLANPSDSALTDPQYRSHITLPQSKDAALGPGGGGGGGAQSRRPNAVKLVFAAFPSPKDGPDPDPGFQIASNKIDDNDKITS